MNFRDSASSRSLLAVAALAVIFHALMPLWMAVPAQTGVRMEMCSTQGVKSVFVKFDTGSKPAPGKALQARCPLCLAGAHFALTLPVDVQPALLSGMGHVQRSVYWAAPHLALVWSLYQARAPPLLSA